MRSFYKPTFSQQLAMRVVDLYPLAWRKRYADEMLLILEEVPPGPKTILNLLLHLVDAYLHRDLVQERIPTMLQRMRFNGLIVYSAALIFFFASFVAQLRITAPEQVPTILPTLRYTSSPLINVMHIALNILLLFIVIGGLPLLLAASWKAMKERQFRTMLLCLLGLASPFFMLIITLVALAVFEALGLPNAIFAEVTLLILFVGLGLSLALIFFAVQRVTPGRRVTRYVFFLATLIPLIMLVSLGSLLLGAAPVLSYAFSMGETTFFVREVLLIVIMVGALVFALISLRKGWRARQDQQADLVA